MSSKAPAEKPRRRWRRRLAIAGLVVVLLLLIVRISLPWVVPAILDGAASDYGLTVEVEDLSFALLSGRVELRDLVVSPAGGGETIARLGYVRADLDVGALLSGRVVVERADVDGVDLLLARDEAGDWPLLERFRSTAAAEPEEETDEDEEEEETALSLASPVEVRALRVQNVRAVVRDAYGGFETRIDAHVLVTDLGTPGRTGRIEALVTATDVLEALHVRIDARPDHDDLAADLDVRLRGLRLAPLAAYLEPIGLRPVADEIGLAIVGRAEAVVSGDAIAADVALENLRLTADGREAAAVDAVAVEAASIGREGIDLRTVHVGGVRWRGERRPDGSLRTCGIDLVPVEASPVVTAPPDGATVDTTEEGPATSFRLDDLVVGNVRADWTDPTLGGERSVLVRELRVAGIETVEDTTLRLTARLASLGVVEEVLVEGTALPFAARREVHLSLGVEGFDPTALKEVLAAAGLEATFERADLGARLDAAVATPVGGAIEADVSLRDIRFDAGNESARLGVVRASGVRVDGEANRTRILEVEVRGLRLTASREASGELRVPGFRLVAPPDRTETAATPGEEVPPAEVRASAPGSVLELARLILDDHEIVWRDEAVSPTAEIRIQDIEVEVTDLALGGSPSPAGFRVLVRAPGLADEMRLQGKVTPSRDRPFAAIDLRAAGVSARAAAPYLATAGLEPELERGTFEAHLAIGVRRDDQTLGAEIALEEVVLRDGSIPLAGIDAVRIQGLLLDPGRLRVESASVQRPRLAVRRDAAGHLHALGFRLVPPPPAAASDAGSTPSMAGPAAAAPPSDPLSVTLGLLAIDGASMSWTDESVAPVVTVTPTVDVTVEEVSHNAERTSTRAKLALTVPETGTQLTANASLERESATTRATVDLRGEMLRAGAFAPYLPEGLAVTLEEGRLRASLEALVGDAADGGERVEITVRDVDLRDGEEGAPLLALESLRAVVSRFDPDAKVVAVDELTMAGLAAEIRKGADGSTRLPGVSLRPPTADAAGAPEEGASGAPAPAPRRSLPRPRLDDLPLVTVGKIDLEIARLGWLDESRPGARPLRVEGLRIRNPEPVELLGEDPAARPPLTLRIDAVIPPVVKSLTATVRLEPFADEPEAALDLLVEGIQGSGLAEILPGIEESLDAAALRDATFRLKTRAALRLRRRDPLDFDISRGFGAELEVRGAALVNGDGAELFGIDEVLVDVKRVEPETGDVHVKSIEVTGPRGDVTVEEGGLRVLGLLLKEKAPPPSSPAPATAATASATRVAPAKPGPELRVDSLYVEGARTRFRDLTVDPVLDFPVKDLLVEVRGFTTRALTESVPIRFAAILRSGLIDLPFEEEKRAPAVEEIGASGRVILHPKRQGWIKLGVSALELSNLAGPSKEAGFDLTGGVLDLGLNVRFLDDGEADTSVRASLTDLDIDEPPDGPISSLLQLPAPLNVVIFVLEDAGGALDIPLDFTVDEEGVGSGAIASQAVKVLTLLIADAIASSPFKLVSGLGGILGIAGEEDPPSDEPPVDLAFGIGGTRLDRANRVVLTALIERLRDEDDLVVTLTHELGRGDVERISERANPSREECLDLVTRLRARRAEILRLREIVAADARAALAAGREGEAERATNRLADLDRRLGLGERALDQLANLLKPGAERRAMRRTREGTLVLGRIRLREVRRALLDAGLERAADRVRVRRARWAEPERDGGGLVRISIARAAPE